MGGGGPEWIGHALNLPDPAVPALGQRPGQALDIGPVADRRAARLISARDGVLIRQVAPTRIRLHLLSPSRAVPREREHGLVDVCEGVAPGRLACACAHAGHAVQRTAVFGVGVLYPLDRPRLAMPILGQWLLLVVGP